MASSQDSVEGSAAAIPGPPPAPPPIRLAGRDLAQRKQHVAGTHRTRCPRETVEDYGRFMPQMGITRLANVTGLDSIGMPVFTAIRPNSRSIATAQGKGVDRDSARASALMESIECWHAEHIDLPLRWEPWSAFRRQVNVADVHRLPRHRDGHLRLDRPLHWIEGFDLIGQRPLWVPHELVWMSWVVPPEFRFTFYQSSNGLASGNHLLEAISHGLGEVIERDAEALWRASEAPMARVDLATIEPPDCRQVIEQLEAAGVYVWISDITSDLGIPCYACFIMERPDQASGRALGIYNGFGCHLSPAVALLRAVTEAAQSRVTYISGSRDDLFYEGYEQLSEPALLREAWGELQAAPASQSFRDRPSLAAETFEEDVAVLLEALRRAGMEQAAVVDLTRPEFGIPVVKCVVPGLEGPDDDECLRGERVARLATKEAP
jgi:ribosomal protein S12 methylthiotransferase accessory factor